MEQDPRRCGSGTRIIDTEGRRGCGLQRDGLMRVGPAMEWVRRCLGGLALLLALAPVVVDAAVLAEPEARAVRQVVQAQLDAFAADDAARAFSYASASIQARFGNADNFMGMVRSGYPMVVRPAAVSFFLAQVDGGPEGAEATVRQSERQVVRQVVQQVVQLRDREGRLWRATYLLEQQAGAGWRIGGCVVVADNGKSST